jgi:hypothetical protein
MSPLPSFRRFAFMTTTRTKDNSQALSPRRIRSVNISIDNDMFRIGSVPPWIHIHMHRTTSRRALPRLLTQRLSILSRPAHRLLYYTYPSSRESASYTCLVSLASAVQIANQSQPTTSHKPQPEIYPAEPFESRYTQMPTQLKLPLLPTYQQRARHGFGSISSTKQDFASIKRTSSDIIGYRAANSPVTGGPTRQTKRFRKSHWKDLPLRACRVTWGPVPSR